MDRFLLKTIIGYPSKEEEIEIMKNNSTTNTSKLKKILNKKDITEIKKEVSDVFISDNIYEYIRDLIFYTRENKDVGRFLAY